MQLRNSSFTSLTLDSATCLGKLIYTSVILHRFRRSRSATRAWCLHAGHAEAGLDTNNLAGAPPNPFRSVPGDSIQRRGTHADLFHSDQSRDPSPAPPQQSGSGAAANYVLHGAFIQNAESKQ